MMRGCCPDDVFPTGWVEHRRVSDRQGGITGHVASMKRKRHGGDSHWLITDGDGGPVGREVKNP
jgi:hypothetical protein